MRKRAPQFEWHMAAGDADWERLQASPRPDDQPADDHRRHLQRYVWGVAALLLLLAGAGGWLWHSPQAKVEVSATVKHEHQAAVPALVPLSANRSDDPINASWWRQQSQAVRGLCAAIQTAHLESHWDEVLQTAQFQWDQTVACLITTIQHGAVAYRQTHFYRWTKEGWLPTAPDPALWGLERSRETRFFLFRFRQNDTPVVIAVAPQVDTLYQTIRQNFGLPLIPATGKLVVEVSVTQSPGDTRFQPHNYERFVMEDRLVVASPARYLAPIELTDAELLAQSIALPLLDQVLVQAREQYQLDAAWQPLLSGLRLWHVWEMDLPLAAWREEVVTWLYTNLYSTGSRQPPVLPERYTDLCAAHKLWLPSPMQMHIPLMCAEVDLEHEYFSLWGYLDPPTHLEHISLSLPEAYPYEEVRLHRGQTVALATLVEYATVTYGRERLPVLVAGLGQYESWDTLIPAVFGVSPAAFEAGWQAYLAERYAVSLP